MRIGDRFKARAEFGATRYLHVEGSFVVESVTRAGIYTCAIEGSTVTRLKDGQPHTIGFRRKLFKLTKDGLMRELDPGKRSFESGGFCQVEPVLTMGGMAVTEEELDAAVMSALESKNPHETPTEPGESGEK